MPERRLHRDLVLTAASLSVAHAAQRGATLYCVREAQRLIKLYPGSGITPEELAAELEGMKKTQRPPPRV